MCIRDRQIGDDSIIIGSSHDPTLATLRAANAGRITVDDGVTVGNTDVYKRQS